MFFFPLRPYIRNFAHALTWAIQNVTQKQTINSSLTCFRAHGWLFLDICRELRLNQQNLK